MQHIAPHGAPADLHLLTSFDDVCRVLGGTKKIVALTGNTRASVANWKKAQRFPARHYHLMRVALLDQGFVGDVRLWGFTARQSDTVAA